MSATPARLEMEARAELEADLRRRFRTKESTVDVRGVPTTLLHPLNADDLISEADVVKDDRLPYWADVWPSSQILAGEVAKMTGNGRTFLELGCGSGLVTVAASRAGFAVTATDYYDDALNFAKLNAWKQAGVEPITRMVDWRAFPEDLGRFDVVAASDVLYEKAYAALIAQAFALTLAPGGVALLADPGRIARDDCLRECGKRGLSVDEMETHTYREGTIVQRITTYAIRWRRGAQE